MNELATKPEGAEFRIGHPAGIIRVRVSLEETEGVLRVQSAFVERTARRILGGYVHVPRYKLGYDDGAGR